MRASIFIAFLLTCSIACVAKDRQWQTGTLVDSETERGSRTVGIPSTVGSGPLIATLRNDITLYEIDDGTYFWIVSRRMTKKSDKPLDVTVNAPVKFVIENGDCYLLDNGGNEHKLTVEKKTLKSKAPDQ